MQNNTADSVVGTKVKTINTYDITASTMEILESKRFICEKVLDNCVAVRDYVWNDFLREAAPTIRLAESNIDPRRSLAESLIKDIPLDVCTLAYNMSFEKNVIKNLAELYPDLSNHLMNIYNNIKDLMIPFKDREYYTKDMHGSYSIKYVLPALFPNDESLELIHNGSEAMNTYANLSNYSKEEQEHIRERLLKYCELDTYAMVKIYEKLLEKTSYLSSIPGFADNINDIKTKEDWTKAKEFNANEKW